MINRTPAPPPSVVMFGMVTAYWLPRAIGAATRLEVPEALKAGPKPAAQLAAECGAHEDSLRRLLRALASHGVFTELANDCWAKTELSATLERGGQMHGFALSIAGGEHYEAWADLEHGIRTGQTPFEHRFKMNAWEYYSRHPEAAADFNEAMTGFSNVISRAVLDVYDFSPFRKIVDIGGGHGGMLAAILEANPSAEGVVFDQPQVVEGAAAGRATIEGGDFFQSVTEGGDAYLMKFILHDWQDRECGIILRNIRRSILPHGRLIVFESVLLGPNEPDFGKMMDLNMLAIPGGRERTEGEFAALFAANGFRLVRVIPTDSTVSIIEAEPC